LELPFAGEYNNSNMESRVGNGKYEILGKLGSGSFGEIYEGTNRQLRSRADSNQSTPSHQDGTLALTQEKNREDKPSRLMQEIRMYKLLQGLRTMLVEAAGVCRLHHHGTENDYNYLIIDRLASSLDDLFQLW
jgi:serine/threonine protein kinase